LGLPTGTSGCKNTALPCFVVNVSQHIELIAAGPDDHDLIDEVGFSVDGVLQMRDYLKSHGIETTEIAHGSNGLRYFECNDPQGHRIAFVDPEGAGSQKKGPDQVSFELIHTGFVVNNREAEDHFYKDILGFHLYWHGGMKDDKDDWVAMQSRNGTDWVEYMLNISPDASKHTLGVMNHIALGVRDIHAAEQQLIKNGWKPTEEPKVGRDGKWQLNVYDPDDTRVEFMEFTPKEKPCCSEFTGKHPGPY